jgi:hypothetical protein
VRSIRYNNFAFWTGTDANACRGVILRFCGRTCTRDVPIDHHRQSSGCCIVQVHLRALLPCNHVVDRLCGTLQQFILTQLRQSTPSTSASELASATVAAIASASGASDQPVPDCWRGSLLPSMIKFRVRPHFIELDLVV